VGGCWSNNEERQASEPYKVGRKDYFCMILSFRYIKLFVLRSPVPVRNIVLWRRSGRLEGAYVDIAKEGMNHTAPRTSS
jgi:hypothetical protein